MNNQSIKADAGKAKLSLVPPKIIYAIARIREYGNNKYPEGGPDNWKDVEIDRYRDAAYRHLLEYLKDPHGYDKESGLPHLWHLACNIAFLCELEDFNLKIQKSTPLPEQRPLIHPEAYYTNQLLKIIGDSKGIISLPPSKKSLKSKISASIKNRCKPVIARVSAIRRKEYKKWQNYKIYSYPTPSTTHKNGHQDSN